MFETLTRQEILTDGCQRLMTDAQLSIMSVILRFVECRLIECHPDTTIV